MQAQRQQHERANPKLARAVARNEGALLFQLSVLGGGSQGNGCGRPHPRPTLRLNQHPTRHPLPAADDPLAILKEDKEQRDEPDSDEEWKEIKARAAARHVVKTAPKARAL